MTIPPTDGAHAATTHNAVVRHRKAVTMTSLRDGMPNTPVGDGLASRTYLAPWEVYMIGGKPQNPNLFWSKPEGVCDTQQHAPFSLR